MVSGVDHVLVTPNTLTETSNLLGHHREPERSRLFRTLRILIGQSRDVVVSSADAAGHWSFSRLGLTDTGLLGLVSWDNPLFTVDLYFYLAAVTDRSWAINYRYLQERRANSS